MQTLEDRAAELEALLTQAGQEARSGRLDACRSTIARAFVAALDPEPERPALRLVRS